jgi:membrane associated rhomboid family serine protease
LTEEVVTTCFHHKDRETGRSCTRCGRPACADCLIQAAVGSHCFECVRAARPPAKERQRRWNATAGPLVTKVLIGINAVVFALTFGGSGAGLGGDVESHLVLFGPAVSDGEWWRLVTSGFVHFGIIHIAFNMVLLYRLGDMLEPALGRIRFTILYFAGLLGGSAGALILSPNASTAGASGAVFGLMAAFLFANRQGTLNVRDPGIGGLLAINLVLTFAVSGVSIGGHLGGLVGGVVAAAVLWSPPFRP